MWNYLEVQTILTHRGMAAVVKNNKESDNNGGGEQRQDDNKSYIDLEIKQQGHQRD